MNHIVNGKQSTDEQRRRGAHVDRKEANRAARREKADALIRVINRRDAETQRGAA